MKGRTDVLRHLIRPFARRPLYAYRRWRDSGSTTLPTDREFAKRLGHDGIEVILQFSKTWTGGADRLPDCYVGDPTALRNVTESGERSMNGEFDVLGSGPSKSIPESVAPGAFGHRYDHRPNPSETLSTLQAMQRQLESAKKFLDDPSPETADLLRWLEESEYQPIEWHTDIKSGYRWDPDGWWLDQRIGQAPGADIKVPWEISRGHDMVALAFLSNVEPESGAGTALSLRMLDWIAANPARRGVNWRSTMEVAIRATNWIWALAVASVAGVPSPALTWIVAKSLEQHARFITRYPDRGGRGAGNHHIADMAGLAHIAAALPMHLEAPRWAEIAARGLGEQAQLAVGADGFSYEGAVGYHRYIAELLIHGTLATLRFPESWPASHVIEQRSHWEQLRRMGEVLEFLEKPNGHSPQFGDHDAGRFIKFLCPAGPAGDEDPLDLRHVNALLAGVAASSTKQAVMQGILPTVGINERRIGEATSALTGTRKTEVPGEVRGGVWVAKAGPFWVAVRCFNAEKGAPTGHLHDDSLSIEICLGGQEIVVDPGSGVYTADREVRDRMRSRGQHSTSGPADDPGPLNQDPFVFNGLGKTIVQNASAHAFSATYEANGWSLERVAEVDESRVRITDRYNGECPWRQVFVFHPGVSPEITGPPNRRTIRLVGVKPAMSMHLHGEATGVRIEDGLYSPGYGTLATTSLVIVEHAVQRSSVVEFRLNDPADPLGT